MMSRDALEKAWELVLKGRNLPCGQCKQAVNPNDKCPLWDHNAIDCAYWERSQDAPALKQGKGFAYSVMTGDSEFQQYNPEDM
tara:strand:+ start:1020 stop:1268 length:249 start_codon:yes stop_codon:yes gene_type:complete